MATLGQWSGTSIAQFPTTSWTAPNGIFATQDRNDGSAYSFNSATSTLTLPSSGLADGYLVVAGFESLITHNNRHNPHGRFTQASGTGNFVSAVASGYARNNGNNSAYVRTWAFIDNPSASAAIQFQWKRDTGTGSPAGSTAFANLQVIPVYYSNIGMYASTNSTNTGNITVTKLTGFTATTESDTAAIEIASDTVTVKGNNKRYLVLGGQYFEDGPTNRTQRWHTLGVDGTYLNEASGYSYIRDGSNNETGEMFTWLVETATADITLDQGIWRGPTIGTFPNTGSSVSQNTSSSNAQHAWVVLELNDDAKVFRTTNSAQQNANITSGVDLDIASVGDIDFNDADTFTRGSDTGIDVAVATDVLLGANVSGGYTSSSGTRGEIKSEFTVAGTPQISSRAGDYGRGDQGTVDTWGWGSTNLSFHAVTAGQDVGIETERTGDGAPIAVLSGYVGFWGIDLDTLEPAGGSDDLLADDVESASEVTTPSIGQTHELSANDVESASEATTPTLGQTHDLAANDVEAASEVTSPAIGQTHDLSADDTQAASEVTAPSIGQTHALSADDVESASEVSTPALSTSGSDDLLADDVEAASEVSSPAIGQTHELNAVAVEAASEISSPAIGQEHGLGAVSVEAASEVSTPALGQTHDLSATSVEASSEVTSPAIGQTHDLTGADVEAASELTSPNLGQPGDLFASPVESASEVSTPALGQVHVLSAVSVEAASNVSAPALGGDKPIRRVGGDDAPRRNEREDFWQKKAEEWLAERLIEAPKVAKRAKKKRKAFVQKFLDEAAEIIAETPAFAPRIDQIKQVMTQLTAPQPDYTEIAAAVAQFRAEQAIKARRRRDIEAVLILAA